MASWKVDFGRRIVSFVICFVMLGMQVLPVGAALLSGDNIVADAAPTISAPLAPQNDECPQDGNSCFSTDGIKISDISVNADGEVQISGHLSFTATLGYQVPDLAGGIRIIESGDFSETFGPFDTGAIFKFDILEGVPGNSGSQRFPDYMDGGPYVEEYGYRVWVIEHTQPLDVGQGAYDWTDSNDEFHSGDEIFMSFTRGYFRNLEEYDRNLGTPKHKSGTPQGAAVHEWDGYLVQDFVGDGGATVYHGVMIYNHNRCRAYAVVNGILDAYWDAGGPSGWLTVPVSDEYEWGGIDDEFEYLYIDFSDWIHWLQRFEHGFISSKDGINYDDYQYHPVGGNIDLYVYTTDEGKGRVYLSLDIDSVPGLPDEESLEVHITGPGEGNMWPMSQESDGRYYGHYGYDLEFGTSINLGILISRSSDGAIGVVPRDQYGIDIPIERGYEKNGIDLLPTDLIADLDCSIAEGGSRFPKLITIRGRLSDGIVDSSHSHPSDAPLIDIEVELWRNGNKLRTDVTNEDGEYLFSNVVFGRGYKINFSLDSSGNPDFKILYGTQIGDDISYGKVVQISKSLDLSDPNTGMLSLAIDYDELELAPASLDDHKSHLGDVAAIYVHSRQALCFFMNISSEIFSLPIHTFSEYNTSEFAPAFYLPFSETEGDVGLYGDVVIHSTLSLYEDNNRPDNREWHEIGHAYQDRAISMSGDKGNVNHKGYKNPSTGDSWQEGWAEFWSVAIADSLGDNRAYMYRGWGKEDSLHYNYQVWEKGRYGNMEEFAVASLLWDIVDQTGLEWWEPYKCKGVLSGSTCLGRWVRDKYISREDKVDISISDLWEIIDKGNKLNDLDNIYELYKAFEEYADDYDYEIDDINDLFIVHGFFRDGDGANADRQYQGPEPVGYGGRVEGDGRFTAPVTAKTAIRLNVENSEGRIITDGIVRVNVHHNPPLDIYDFSYELKLEDLPSNNLMWLEPPLTGVGTAVEIQIEAEEQTSGILKIDDWAFWLGVDNTKVGYGFDYLHNYLGEYTFTLGNPTPIVFDLKSPETTSVLGGTHGNSGWLLNDPVSITLTSVDKLVGTEKIEYGFDTTYWFTYTTPFTATHDDTVYYRATDWLGNVEPTQQITIQIDTIAPTSTLSLSSTLPYSETFTTDVTVLLSGSDGGPSGLDYVEYRANGGAWLQYDVENPPIITQNGDNILEYRAVDIAGNVEPTHVVTLTLDKTVNTIIPLDVTQTNRRAAIRAVMHAVLNDQHPLMAAQAFTVDDEDYPIGTVIVPGEVAGDFTKAVNVGLLDVPTAHVLYPQDVALFESTSPDERASWELPDLRKALETYLGLHEWPLVDETVIASDTISSDIVFFPAGVTPDVLNRFAETGAMDALVAQAEAGRWFVFEADAAQVADFAGLVPPGTVEANALPAGVSPLTLIQTDAIMAYNWPEAMMLTRYNDAPRFHITGDLVRVADYADEALGNEPAIVMRRVGKGGVILIGGHAAQSALSYSLLHNALFSASAEQVDSQVSVEQQFMPGAPLDTVPGLEPEIPVLVRSTVANYSQDAVNDFVYTEFITSGYKLLSSPTVDIGEVVTRAIRTSQGTLVLQAGTWITWTADTLSPGSHELTYLAANITTDTLKPGEVTIGEAQFRYTDSQTQTVQLMRPDAVVRAKLPALIAHNPTDEPDNVYPLPSEGFYRHIREDLENKLETRANNTTYTITVPLIDVVRDAFDQTVYPTIKHYGWYRPIVVTDVEETHAFVFNTIMGYPDRDYPIPMGASSPNWFYGIEDWNGLDWIRIPNPRRTFVHIPVEYRDFIVQEPGNGDLLVPAMTLTFDLGTLLPYDWREPAIRYLIHSRELFGRGISFSVEPVTDTLVLEGHGGSVYTAVGQHPVPFREYFDDAAVNNPIAPVPSEITYTDLWGRAHAVTETVRSSFYDIIPYDKTGDAVSVQMASTYGMTGESGERLFDFPPYQVVTLTVMLKAQSVNRDLSAEQLIIQEMLPRGLGYDIELVTWESSHGSFQLLDENTISVPAFDLLYFQGALPENEPQTITITARLRAYPQNPREGQTLVDGGARIATQNEWGDPSQFDTAMTHVRVEQAYQASTEIEKWVASPDVSRHGGTIYELIRTNGAADVARFTEEVYIDSTGTGDKSAVAKTGMSFGPDLYFGTVTPGGETLLVYELTNNSGEAWHNVGLTYTTHPGIRLTPILTDGLEPPPNVYDTPYLWAEEIPDISRGVYYYRVHVDESVPTGVMYPINFTLTGENVPDADEFPLPVARVGVGGEVQRIQGQAHDIQVVDTSPVYAPPSLAKGMTDAQFATAQTITDPEALEAYFTTLTRTVPFTYRVVGDLTWITYTIPAEWQTLPAQDGTEIQQAWALLVQTEIGDVQPGTRLVNHGPQAHYTDTHGAAFTADGNPTHVIAHGPVLTGTYTIESVTSPFYGGAVIEPMPGESVEVCIDIAVWNAGNYIASDPVISATVTSEAEDFEIVSMDPEPIAQDEGGTTFTWALNDILPYGSTGEDLDQDVEHIEVCVWFTVPDEGEIESRMAMLQDAPFYVPLVQSSHARYVDNWGEVPFTIREQIGGDYGLYVGGDPLPAPDLYQATWDATRQRTLLAWHTVAGARDYVVYRSTEPDRDFRQVGQVTSGTSVEDYVYDDPLASTYYYVIRARSETLAEGRHSQVMAVHTGTDDQVFKAYLPVVLKQ